MYSGGHLKNVEQLLDLRACEILPLYKIHISQCIGKIFYVQLWNFSLNILTIDWKIHVCILTHWGRVTHICVDKLTIIDSDNGLSPGRRQAIIWTNAGILLIGPLGTNFSEISIEILTFSFKKMHLKVSSAKWRPFCIGPNVLRALRLKSL